MSHKEKDDQQPLNDESIETSADTLNQVARKLGVLEPEYLLKLAQEPLLLERQSDAGYEAYRFYHKPYKPHLYPDAVNQLIRIECLDGDFLLTAKTCHPAKWDIKPWKLHCEKRISQSEFRNLASSFERADFWNLKRELAYEGPLSPSSYHIEGVKSGVYHSVFRYMQLPDDLDRCFQQALDLAGLENSGD
ncbi:MAG: hypothetical protein RH917_07280 [Lacipirellulaceae bacterium]